MTTPVALALGAMIAIALGYDLLRNDMTGTIFVLRKLMDLIEYLAFWR